MQVIADPPWLHCEVKDSVPLQKPSILRHHIDICSPNESIKDGESRAVPSPPVFDAKPSPSLYHVRRLVRVLPSSYWLWGCRLQASVHSFMQFQALPLMRKSRQTHFLSTISWGMQGSQLLGLCANVTINIQSFRTKRAQDLERCACDVNSDQIGNTLKCH